jgi:hypothetical protein
MNKSSRTICRLGSLAAFPPYPTNGAQKLGTGIVNRARCFDAAVVCQRPGQENGNILRWWCASSCWQLLHLCTISSDTSRRRDSVSTGRNTNHKKHARLFLRHRHYWYTSDQTAHGCDRSQLSPRSRARGVGLRHQHQQHQHQQQPRGAATSYSSTMKARRRGRRDVVLSVL